MVRGAMRERSDVREMYLYTERDPSSSSSLSRRAPRSSPSLAPSLTVHSHTLPLSARLYPLALPVADQGPENTDRALHVRGPGPLNLTWQVPAEWTRLGPSQRALPLPVSLSLSLSPYFVPMPRRLSACFCLTFSVLPVYSQLFFVSLSLCLVLWPSLMMAAIALACIMAHKKCSTSALNHLQRVTRR